MTEDYLSALSNAPSIPQALQISVTEQYLESLSRIDDSSSLSYPPSGQEVLTVHTNILQHISGSSNIDTVESITDTLSSNEYLSTADVIAPVNTHQSIMNSKIMKIKRRIAQTKRRIPTSYDRHDPITTITSIEEFLDMIEKSPSNGLVVVKYHAKFCKICARVKIKFKKLANKLTKTETPVPIAFADIEVTANSDLCSILGIKTFPSIQIYRNMECVASFRTGPAHTFKKVVDDSISEKLRMTNDEWNTFRSEYEEEILNGLIKMEKLALKTVEQDVVIKMT